MIAGCAIRPLTGETSCGDACRWWPGGDNWTLCVADGLGHGAEAEVAAQQAVAGVEDGLSLPIADIMQAIDGRLRNTRGAACAVARVDVERRKLDYLAVGNIRGALFGVGVRHLEASPGIVGAHLRPVRAVELSWTPGDLLVIWTDGADVRLSLDEQSRRLSSEPTRLAERLLEQFGSSRDDALVLCCFLDDGPP